MSFSTRINAYIFALFCWLGVCSVASAQSTSNQILAINAASQGDGMLLKIEMKNPLLAPPAAFSVANPARIALDFPDTVNALGRSSQVVNEGTVRSLNIIEAGNRTRVVVNLTSNQTHKVRLEGQAVLVSLSPVPQTSEEGNRFQTTTEVTSPRTRETATGITNINFRRGKDGEGRVIVDLSNKGNGVDIRQQGKELIADFPNVSIPSLLLKKMDVTDFATPVLSVTSATRGSGARLTITPKGLWEHSAYQTDNQFIIEVRPIVENPNKLVQGSRLGYQGPRVSINYQNGDVRGLLRLMAEELGLNAVISETVTGNTTLVLKDVPADQVIDIIFQQKGLDMRKNGNVILIAPRDELATREKLENEAKLQLAELEPLRTESFQINYQKADAIQKLLTDANQRMISKRGSAVVDARTNMLFVQDTSGKLDEIRKVIAKVDVPVRQVLIEARIVEADDKFAKNVGARLGIMNGRTDSNASSGQNRVAIGADYQNTGQKIGLVSGTATMPLAQQVNLPASPRSGTAGALSFILYNSAMTRFLNLEVSALEADGKGKVISSPRVMTADQVEAIIEQGVEIPYQQASSSGATSVSFRKANLSLKVKPHITPDGKITMTLTVSKDTPNSALQTGSGVAIDTKRIQTEVLVENGGTVVIGGIYTQTQKDQTQKIPFLGDLPILGAAFRNNERIDDKTELLVFITPRVVTDRVDLR